MSEDNETEVISESVVVEHAFDDFPDDFQEYVKNRLMCLGELNTIKKGFGGLEKQDEDIDLNTAELEDIVALEMNMETKGTQIPYKYIVQPNENYDTIQSVIQTLPQIINNSPHIQVPPTSLIDRLPEDSYDYILSSARSQNTVDLNTLYWRLNQLALSSTQPLHINTTDEGEVISIIYTDRIYANADDPSLQDHKEYYESLSQLENIMTISYSIMSVYTSKPVEIPEEFIQDEEDVQESSGSSSRRTEIGFQ